MQITLNGLAPDSKNSQIYELSDTEASCISGGTPLAMAAAVAFLGALSAAESFGNKVGKALYYATH